MLVLLKTYFDQLCEDFISILEMAKGTQRNSNLRNLEKIEELSNALISEKTKDNLLEMIKKRIEIVHYDPQEKITDDFIKKQH